MPEIEHHDLVLFADQKVNLKKDEVDDQRAQVNRLRDRIEAKIAVTPGYGLVKSLHAGSVAMRHCHLRRKRPERRRRTGPLPG